MRFSFLNDVDDASGCGSGGCGDGPSSPVAAAVERFALVKRQQFSRCAVAVDSAGASCAFASVAVASCSGMADAGASFDADSVVLGCEEIDDWKRCR